MQRNRNRKFCCQSPKWSQITITYKSSKGNVNIRNSLLRHAQQYQVTLPPFHLKESNLQLKLTPRACTHLTSSTDVQCPSTQWQLPKDKIVLVHLSCPLLVHLSCSNLSPRTLMPRASPSQYCETSALESVVVALP